MGKKFKKKRIKWEIQIIIQLMRYNSILLIKDDKIILSVKLHLQCSIKLTYAAAAAAAAKSLQSCPTLCNPIDSSPPGSPVPGILQARTLEWIAISFSNASK